MNLTWIVLPGVTRKERARDQNMPKYWRAGSMDVESGIMSVSINIFLCVDIEMHKWHFLRFHLLFRKKRSIELSSFFLYSVGCIVIFKSCWNTVRWFIFRCRVVSGGFIVKLTYVFIAKKVSMQIETSSGWNRLYARSIETWAETIYMYAVQHITLKIDNEQSN